MTDQHPQQSPSLTPRKKKHHDPLPPPPPELDLNQFDSKFRSKKHNSASSSITPTTPVKTNSSTSSFSHASQSPYKSSAGGISGGRIPPPPPPLPILRSSTSKPTSQPKPTLVDMPPPPLTSTSTSKSIVPPPPPPPLPARASPKVPARPLAPAPAPGATMVDMPPPPVSKSKSNPASTVTTIVTAAATAADPVGPVMGAGNPHSPAYLQQAQAQAQAQQHQVPPSILRRKTNTNVDNNNSTQTPKQKQPPLPPLSHLAPRQSTLPVLVVPTATSTQLAHKNNLSLSHLFNGLASTIAPPNNLPSSHIAPRLPPFRSIGKSILLNWNQIHVRFLEGDDLEVVDPVETDWELNRACGNPSQTNSNDNNNDNDNDDIDKDGGIPKVEELEELLCDLLRQKDAYAISDQEEEKKLDHTEVSQLLQEKVSPNNIEASSPTQPWLRSVRHTLDTCTDNLQQDLHSCPIVALLIASSSDPYYLECLKELKSIHHLPRPHHSGHYDPTGMRFFYLLLHDNVHGPKDFEEGVALIQMRQAFPNQICAVLRINSLDPRLDLLDDNDAPKNTTTDDEKQALWKTHAMLQSSRNQSHNNNKAGILHPHLSCGQALSEDDLLNIRRFIATLVADCIIPAMERRIFNLNVAVNNAKRGVKNVLKSFWRKPKDGSSSNNNSSASFHDNFSSSFHGPNSSKHGSASHNNTNIIGGGVIKYTYDQIESQIRLLADSLFLMRDYESALSIYRLAKDDYKSDRATVHYASVYEMMALCMHSMDPLGTRTQNNRDLHTAIETALFSYTRGAEEERFLLQQGGGGSSPALQSLPQQQQQQSKAASLGYCNKLATRLCLVICSIPSLYQSRHLETADLLASASSHETPLCAAILLEQSARHYKAANMHKKYAFHMLMAGHMFRTAKVEKHSMRCFTLSHQMYEDSQWKPLSIHLESALAQQLYGLGRLEVAMWMYCKLVGYSGVGRNQHKFLQNLLDIFRTHPEAALQACQSMRASLKGHHHDNDDSSESQGEKDSNVSSSTVKDPLLEIPGMMFPRVITESLEVSVEQHTGASTNREGELDEEVEEDEDINAAANNYPHNHNAASMKRAMEGDDVIWQEMSCHMESELRASQKRNHPNNHDSVPAEQMTNAVIDEIDQEKFTLASSSSSQSKKNNKKSTPTIRYRNEPILVRMYVTNPTELQIPMSELQLVASLESGSSKCTNEYSTQTSKHDVADKKEYKFRCSLRSFEAPDFTRSTNTDTNAKPFFVVDKHSLVLEPNAMKKITLAICPLVEGSLTIKGMRWKVFDDIWLYHEFKTLGPLLQDTPEHRSNRVRGESKLLKSKISHDMPSLIVETLHAKNSVLQGEICKWTLRLTNLGSATATNITMKTNLPWVTIKPRSDPNTEKGECDARSQCIGPSGTFMHLPLSKSKSTSTSTSTEGELSTLIQNINVIHPGESAEVDVHVRASGGGKHELYLLFRYESHKDDGGNKLLGKQKHRYVKKVVPIAVFPSLNLSASLMPSYWEKNEHVLSVEMTNYRSDQQTKVELFLHNLCIASRYYRAIPIPGQIRDTVDLPILPSSAVQIGWQERITMHYRVIPLDNAEYTSSNCPFEEEHNNNNNNNKMDMDFLCLENAHEKFKAALKRHDEELQLKAREEQEQNHPRSISQIRRANTATSNLADESLHSLKEDDTNTDASKDLQLLLSSHPTSLGSLCPVGDDHSSISLICGWSAYVGESQGDKIIEGQHHLSQLNVRPKEKKKGCPLTITSKHKSNITHDFSCGLLRTDLVITVRNRLIGKAVEFEFSVEQSSEFNLIGAESFHWTLEGGEDITIPLLVEISASGVYNLQNVRLAVKSNGSKIPYLFPLQWILKVNDD